MISIYHEQKSRKKKNNRFFFNRLGKKISRIKSVAPPLKLTIEKVKWNYLPNQKFLYPPPPLFVEPHMTLWPYCNSGLDRKFELSKRRVKPVDGLKTFTSYIPMRRCMSVNKFMGKIGALIAKRSQKHSKAWSRKQRNFLCTHFSTFDNTLYKSMLYW